MPNLTIKGLPKEVHERLRRRAKERGRSLNREVILILESAARLQPPDPEAMIARIEAILRRGKGIPMTAEEIRAARDEGRP